MKEAVMIELKRCTLIFATFFMALLLLGCSESETPSTATTDAGTQTSTGQDDWLTRWVNPFLPSGYKHGKNGNSKVSVCQFIGQSLF